MKIAQEPTFKPVTITLETKEEFISFTQIIDEADTVKKDYRKFMGDDANKLVIAISNAFGEDFK